MQEMAAEARRRSVFNEEYTKMECELGSHSLSRNLEKLLRTPNYCHQYVQFLNRRVTERFFKDFHFGYDGIWHHIISLDEKWNAGYRVKLDENKRIISIAVAVHYYSEPYDDPHVGAEGTRRSLIVREETSEESKRFETELETIYTIPRADKMLKLLCNGKHTADNLNYEVNDTCLRISDSYGVMAELPIENVKLLMEWSFTYLECFCMPGFIRENIPGFQEREEGYLIIRFMSIFDGTCYYDYANIYEAAVKRARRFAEVLHLVMGVPDVESCLETFKSLVNRHVSGGIRASISM